MEFNLLFIGFLYVLISILVMFSIVIYKNTRSLNKTIKQEHTFLMENLRIEKVILENNNQKVILVDHFNETFFDRIFQITKELLLLQKMIFEKHIN